MASILDRIRSDADLPIAVKDLREADRRVQRELDDLDDLELKNGLIDTHAMRDREELRKLKREVDLSRDELFSTYNSAKDLWHQGDTPTAPQAPQGGAISGMFKRGIEAITPSEERLRGIGEGLSKVGDVAVKGLNMIPTLPRLLTGKTNTELLAKPGEQLRGLATGQPGKDISPKELVDKWSAGGTEQVLRERGPGAATIRETAASFVDPLLGVPSLLKRLRPGVRPVQAPPPGPTPQRPGAGPVPEQPSPGVGPIGTRKPVPSNVQFTDTGAAAQIGTSVGTPEWDAAKRSGLVVPHPDNPSMYTIKVKPDAQAHMTKPEQPLAGNAEVVEPPPPAGTLQNIIAQARKTAPVEPAKPQPRPTQMPGGKTPEELDVEKQVAQHQSDDAQTKAALVEKAKAAQAQQAPDMPLQAEPGSPLSETLVAMGEPKPSPLDTLKEQVVPEVVGEQTPTKPLSPLSKSILEKTTGPDILGVERAVQATEPILPTLINKAKGAKKSKPVLDADVTLPETEVHVLPDGTLSVKGNVPDGTPVSNFVRPAKAARKSQGKIAQPRATEQAPVSESKIPSIELPFAAKPQAQVPTKGLKKGKSLEEWAYKNDFNVRDLRATNEIEFRDDLTNAIRLKFKNTREGRAKALEWVNKEHVEPSGEKPIMLYSGIPVDEAGKAARALVQAIRREGKALFTEGMGPKAKLSPLTRAWKNPVANARVGRDVEKVIDIAWESERKISESMNDFRFKHTPTEKKFEQRSYETFDRLRNNELEPVRKAIHFYDKIDKAPTVEELTKRGLNPAQVQAVLGTQEAAKEAFDIVRKELQEAALHRLGHKSGSLTPKEMNEYLETLPPDERGFVKGVLSEVGKKEFYYPHKFPGAYEVNRIDKATGDKIKMLKPEGDERGSSTFSTRRQASHFMQDLSEKYGIPAHELEITDHSKLGFSKHLEHRKGEVGYELHDVQGVYHDYLYEAMRFSHNRQMLRDISDILNDAKSGLAKADKEFLMKYAERVGGKQAATDIALNNWVREVPVLKNIVEPYAPATRILQNGRRFVNFIKLGALNAGSALINTDGLTRHVYPGLQRLANSVKLGDPIAAERYIKQGLQAWLSNASQKLIEKGTMEETLRFNMVRRLGKAMNLSKDNKYLMQKLAHKGALDIQLFGEPLPKAQDTASKTYRYGMALFSTTEDLGRGTSTVASYKLLRKAGLDEEAAVKGALKFTGETLGRYTPAGKPMVYTSQVGASGGMFKTYLHVMLDNAYINLSKPFKEPGAFMRYAGASVAASGVLGLFPGWKDIDDIITRETGTSPTEQVVRNTPDWLAVGLPAWADVDVSERAAAPDIIPNDIWSAMGPLVNTAVRPLWQVGGTAINALVHGIMNEPQSIADDLFEDLKVLLPNTIGAKYLIGKIEQDRITQRRGRTLVKDLTPQEKFIEGTGLPIKREVAEQRQYRILENKKKHIGPEREHLIDAFIEGDDAVRDDWGHLMRKYGITWDMVHAERKRKSQTLTQRQRRSLPQPLKRDASLAQ